MQILSSGTILQNRYRIINILGHGGMGVVYKCDDTRMHGLVAIKQAFFGEPELQKAFEREARLLNRLRHSVLPKVTDYFAEHGTQFLVMEFVDGKDVFQLFQPGRSCFELETVLGWADQLLDALSYLHSQSPPIIHRDIKPQNLKVSANSQQLFLLDFGLAKGSLDRMTSVGGEHSVLGFTRQYAPLEQILRAEERWHEALSIIDAQEVERVCAVSSSPSSDLYSLAATLYHLLTGKPPIEAPIRALSVWSGKPDPLQLANKMNTDIPYSVALVLSRALQINPEHRSLSTAAAMRADLIDARKSSRSTKLLEQLPMPSPTRAVRFPSERSIGTLYLREPDINDSLVMIALGQEFGPARGLVTIPSNKALLLYVKQPVLTNLSPLDRLRPDDLQVLVLAGSEMSDSAFKHIQALGGLKALMAARSGCNDGWLESLKALESLEWLNLAFNKVTDEGLVSISDLTGLRSLDLSGNQVRDGGLKHLCNLAGLKHMSLDETLVCDAELRYLDMLIRLETLRLRNVSLSDSQLGKLQRMENLWYLDISQNPITDSGLKYLAGFSSLEELDVSHTRVSFSGLLQLKEVHSLRQLTIAGIELSTSQLNSLKNELPSCELDNQLTE